MILSVSLMGGFAINVSVSWGYVGHNLWAGWTFEGGVRHAARIALSGWQSCRCLAACPDTPCGVQMAEWKPKDAAQCSQADGGRKHSERLFTFA